MKDKSFEWYVFVIGMSLIAGLWLILTFGQYIRASLPGGGQKGQGERFAHIGTYAENGKTMWVVRGHKGTIKIVRHLTKEELPCEMNAGEEFVYNGGLKFYRVSEDHTIIQYVSTKEVNFDVNR